MTHTGPYDAIFDDVRVEDQEVASDYRLFLRVFFFADFAAFFLRFAIAALLAMYHGGCRISVRSRIDTHCIPITTAQRKKQRLRLMKRVRAQMFGARMRIDRTRMRGKNARARDNCAKISQQSTMQETIAAQALLRCLKFPICAPRARSQCAEAFVCANEFAPRDDFANQNFFCTARRSARSSSGKSIKIERISAK